MRALKMSVALIITLLCSAPLYADIAPFYQGKWGMSPQAVQQLLKAPPVTTTQNANGTFSVSYAAVLHNQTIYPQYIFSAEQKLIGVELVYEAQDISSHVYWEMLDEFKNDITGAFAKPPAFAEAKLDACTRYCYEAAWLNNETYVNLQVLVTPGATLTNCRFNFKFYDNALNAHQQAFDKVKADGQPFGAVEK